MRIVAGEWGGRRLLAPRGGDVRPTSEKVREALFSILGPLDGARVLDLFCGTGALGLEALSRGAEHATFVDTRTATVARNIQRLDARSRTTIERGDARQVLGRLEGTYELIFCDPPYKLADRLAPSLSKSIPDRLATGGRVVVESSAGAEPELAMKRLDRRSYGDTVISIYTAEGER